MISPESSELVREFAALQTTMAATVSGARTGQFVEKLLQGGYSEDTPVVVAYKVSQADELVVHTTVGELESVVKQHKLYRPTLFLVGTAVKAHGPSHLGPDVADEPIRAARPTRWSRRAASRIATRVDEPIAPAPLPPIPLPPPSRTRRGPRSREYSSRSASPPRSPRPSRSSPWSRPRSRSRRRSGHRRHTPKKQARRP